MHLFKTPSGKWAFRVDVGPDPHTGKRRQKSKQGFLRKKDAEAAAQEILRAVRHQNYVEDSSITFGEFAAQFLERYKMLVKERTYLAKRTITKAWSARFGKIPMQKITLGLYQKELNALAKDHKHSTLQNYHIAARTIFKEALKYEVIAKDPTQFAKVPREEDRVEENPLPPFLNKEQLKQFLDAAKKHGHVQDYPMFYLLAYTGMRIGEATALTWDDVDFDNRTIRINKTMVHLPGNSYKISTPKTPASRRTLDVSASVMEVLRRHRVRQLEMRLKAGPIWIKPKENVDFVFVSAWHPGLPTRYSFWAGRIISLLRFCPGLPRIHPHSFRHTHASLLAEAGVSLEEIADRLGHNGNEVTRRIYLHFTEQHRRTVAEKFSRFMGE